MTEYRRPYFSAAARAFGWSGIFLGCVLLQACTKNETAPAASQYRVYAADVSGGAKHCEVPKINPVPGKGADVSMQIGNDGGWCGLPVHQDGPKPFEAGLLTARPAHGTVLIHEVGDQTRIDYTPDHGFTGNDSFAVQLIPGDATLHIAVVVAPSTT